MPVKVVVEIRLLLPPRHQLRLASLDAMCVTMGNRYGEVTACPPHAELVNCNECGTFRIRLGYV